MAATILSITKIRPRRRSPGSGCASAHRPDGGDPTARWPLRGSPARNCVTSTPPPTPTGLAAAWSASYWACADTDVPELHRLGRTIAAWEDQLLAYFTTGGVWNGPTEAVNLLIKRIKKVSDSATSPITGSASSCTAASSGTRTQRHGSEAGHHVLWRRATFGAVTTEGSPTTRAPAKTLMKSNARFGWC